MKLIVIEGNMGIGKSTLCANIAKLLNYKVMDEPVAENPYLEKFYQEPKKYAFEMQLWIMMRRYQMHREALQHIKETGQAVLMDRSIYGDTIFAKVNYMDGNILDDSYQTYLQIKNNLISTLRLPDIVVYLDASVDTIYERIQARSRTCEAGISKEYIEKLDRVYKQWLNSLLVEPSSMVKIVDHSGYAGASDIIKIANLQEYRN